MVESRNQGTKRPRDKSLVEKDAGQENAVAAEAKRQKRDERDDTKRTGAKSVLRIPSEVNCTFGAVVSVTSKQPLGRAAQII